MKYLASLVFVFLLAPAANAAIVVTTGNIIERATVESASGTPQALTARITEEPHKGEIATFENVGPHLSPGDRIYLSRVTEPDGTISYAVYDYYRLPILLALALLFCVLAIALGGIQGVRGLLALFASLFFIFNVLVPGLLANYSPLFVGLAVATLIITLGSYITHGFNKTTTAAVVGMLIAVIVTGLGAYAVVETAHLSGGYAQGMAFAPGYGGGYTDLANLLFVSIVIGLLGVLYDIAIGQAIVVEELSAAGAEADHLYRRALRVGREHIGALVNVLVIAYVGASLPLFLSLHLAISTYGFAFVANSNQIATEIIRILTSGIGLMLAVPITTYVAVRLLRAR